MKHLKIAGASLLVAIAAVLVLAASVSADSSKPTLSLTASPSTCRVNAVVTFTVTVQSKQPAYEIQIFKQAKGPWQSVATASQVAAGQYTAYAKAGPKGKVKFRAGYIDSKGRVTAYSGIVTVTVTK